MNVNQCMIYLKQKMNGASAPNGFTLVEVLIGTVIVCTMAMSIVYVTTISSSQQQVSKLTAFLSQQRSMLQNTINNDYAWQQTTQNDATGLLKCSSTSAGCANLAATGASYNLTLFDASGAQVFASTSSQEAGAAGNAVTTPTSGFGLNGEPCASATTHAPCAIGLLMQWKPLCAAATIDPNCTRPFIQVTGTFVAAPHLKVPGNINFGKFNFVANRQSLNTGVCSANPATAGCTTGQLTVCTSIGWQCVSPNSPNCPATTVTWTDPATNLTCSGPVAQTIRDQSTVASANPPYTGSAGFTCIPQSAPASNGGFGFGTSPICKTAPSNGACGLASGSGSYATPADVTAAGACVAPGSPIAPGITQVGANWNWTCSGPLGGGPSGLCSAVVSAAPPPPSAAPPTTPASGCPNPPGFHIVYACAPHYITGTCLTGTASATTCSGGAAGTTFSWTCGGDSCSETASYCFPEESPVLINEKGLTKQIQELHVGDEILSWSPLANVRFPDRVTHVIRHPAEPRVLLEIRLDNGASLQPTPNHPVWLEEAQAYLPARDIADRAYTEACLNPEGCLHMRTSEGKIARIISIQSIVRNVAVFDIAVAGSQMPDAPTQVGDAHNYFVDGVMVHNKSVSPTCFPTGGVGGIGCPP